MAKKKAKKRAKKKRARAKSVPPLEARKLTHEDEFINDLRVLILRANNRYVPVQFMYCALERMQDFLLERLRRSIDDSMAIAEMKEIWKEQEEAAKR